MPPTTRAGVHDRMTEVRPVIDCLQEALATTSSQRAEVPSSRGLLILPGGTRWRVASRADRFAIMTAA